MQVLLTILLVIGGIIALFLIAALLIPKKFSIQKEVRIHRPVTPVFDYLKQIRNQEKYSVWVMRDPNIRLEYTGTDGEVGFKSAWESEDKNVGIGEQEITAIKNGESIEVEIRFKKPFQATNWARTTVTEDGEGQTRVSQVFYGNSKYPMNVMNLMMDKLVGRDMVQNMNNLKKILEDQA